MVAAELDCKHAVHALESLISLERTRQLLGFPSTSSFNEKFQKLLKIAEGCPKAYKVSGESNGANFSGEICSLNKPFTINGTFPGGTAKTTFTPNSVAAGTTADSGGGNGCVMTGGGAYNVTLKEDGSASIT